MYAQMHLGCDQFDAIGFSIPGVPAFPHFAHNAQVAWCVTHAFADIHDLYVEQFDRADPSRYLHKDDWLRAATTTEDVKVRGGDSHPVQIVETIHGPVVAGDPAHGTALTLKSVQFSDLDRSFDCLLPMLAATSVDSLFQAVRGWGLIDHNLVAADTRGHIGHLVRAVIPRRPAINGWLPVPGWTGEYEWDGVIPAEQMPRVDDPARGFIVTANNRVVTAIPETGDYFCTDAHPPYRARRIEQLLTELGPASPQDMATIHRERCQRARAAVPGRPGGRRAAQRSRPCRPGHRARLGCPDVARLERGGLLLPAALGSGQDRRGPVWPRRRRGRRADATAWRRLGRQPPLVGAAGPAAIR